MLLVVLYRHESNRMNFDFGVNQALVEDQYRRFLDNPDSVDGEWRVFFEQLQDEGRTALAVPSDALAPPNGSSARVPIKTSSYSELAWNLSRLISRFRSRGHYFAAIDPLGLVNEEPRELTPENFGISSSDLEVRLPSETAIARYHEATVREIIQHLQRTYCGSIGYEIMHVEDEEELQWLIDRIENPDQEQFDAEASRWILEHLTDAQEIERFLHSQYIGAKRFSLEGLDAVIPMLHRILDLAGDSGVRESVIGMAHRGRLNVLVNIMKKGFEDLFTEFDDRDSEDLIGRGDVKYHLGYLHWRKSPGGREVRVSLCFNPSHLEFVDPVVVGRCRARLDKAEDRDGSSVLPIQIHGDSAFMGQGVVFETLNLAELEAYRAGGSVHIVLNNQVGFTTSPSASRSSRYASDVVRFLRVPVFHVNADDVYAVMRVARIAFEYRQRFGRDVCIDLVGYRKYGHNEGDEPRFTQPEMYREIDARDSVRDAFAKFLIERDFITDSEADGMVEERREAMSRARSEAQQRRNEMPYVDDPTWAGYFGGPEVEAGDVETGIGLEQLQSLLKTVTTIPDDVDVHDKVQRLYEQRAKVVETNDVDWGSAEMLAYSSLIHEGYHVRLTGQDARRGTFAHRHAYVIDQRTNEAYSPLQQAASNGGWFEAYDSSLSENAVLGFEYGYSLEAPGGLTIWEAQFGDFVNGAQVIIDQFISSGEDKWQSLTGVVMLLPHGFEGMGPEHSYARLGRFLQLCAEDNMQVCDCTTPAQFFHLLRRQVIRPWRKPLVVMTPKSLLRSRDCRSTLEDLAQGSFQRILPDESGTDPSGVRRVLMCSGRIYYDLAKARKEGEHDDVHIIRLEQLYPLHAQELADVLSPYPAGTELVWVQDEPWNMGAWYFIKVRFQAIFGDHLPIKCVSRAESASPATGSGYAHRLENKALMEAAFSRNG